MNGNPPRRPSRRSPRKPGYDYATPGAYFVTLCAFQRKHIFGKVQDNTVALSPIGRIADHYWQRLPSYYDHVTLDEWVIMPNHLHAVVWLHQSFPGEIDAAAVDRCPPERSRVRPSTCVSPGSLNAIIGTYKSLVTRRTNRMLHTPGNTMWQGRFYDHIVRSEHALHHIRRYIIENPKRWALDTYNADASETDPMARDLWRLLRDEARNVRT